MIAAPAVLAEVTNCLAALWGTPGFALACSTVLPADTLIHRTVKFGDTAEWITLQALLCIRDETPLFVVDSHPARQSPTIGLVGALADRVGVWADVTTMPVGAVIRFAPVAVAA